MGHLLKFCAILLVSNLSFADSEDLTNNTTEVSNDISNVNRQPAVDGPPIYEDEILESSSSATTLEGESDSPEDL